MVVGLLPILILGTTAGAGQVVGSPGGDTPSDADASPVLSSDTAAGSEDVPADIEAEDEHDEAADGDEEGAAVLGDWWGLGGEADESPYLGLAELGVVLLVLGLGGYSLGKRTSLVPPRWRRYLLPGHEWTMLTGTALAAPHFFAVEEWEGLGFLVGVLLAIEVVSGLYGRHLHRHVIRLGRGGETPAVLGSVLQLSKRTVFSRWRRIHVLLTVVTAVVLVLHVVTAVGD